jgi:hypothetical protein
VIVVQLRYSFDEKTSGHQVEIDCLKREDANQVEIDLGEETELLLQKFIKALYPEYDPTRVTNLKAGDAN